MEGPPADNVVRLKRVACRCSGIHLHDDLGKLMRLGLEQLRLRAEECGADTVFDVQVALDPRPSGVTSALFSGDAVALSR